jgi:hypothetical protein
MSVGLIFDPSADSVNPISRRETAIFRERAQNENRPGKMGPAITFFDSVISGDEGQGG